MQATDFQTLKAARSLLKTPIEAWIRTRSLGFILESTLLNGMGRILPRKMRQTFPQDPKQLKRLRDSVLALFDRDARNIAQGIYPLSVLKTESPLAHALRVPRVLIDGLGLSLRRGRGKTQAFDSQAKDLLEELPRYYRRNFHFQTDGYLSQKSAELYEHQVEILFSGAADAMRRLILAPLKAHFENQSPEWKAAHPDGQGLTILELAAGTGRATRFIRQAFPRAKIVAVDLSDPYLHVARKRLASYARIDFMQADAAHLPFQDGQFDAVVSVFLFHELPEAERERVIRESLRVLKPSAFLGLVDSIQKGDVPEFDELLEAFPLNYHEPFYRNYSEHPMEALLRAAHFGQITTDTGFLSKVVSALAPASQS